MAGPGVQVSEARALTAVVCDHGEGPLWDPALGLLRCVDLEAGALVDVDRDGAAVRRTVDRIAAAWRPRRGGGMVVAVERGFVLLDGDGRPERRIPAFPDEGIRMNDGTCDPQGRFYCGTMAYDARPGAGTLWRLDPDGTVTAVLGDLTISNGMGFAPDGSFAFHVDTPTQRIDRLTFDADGGMARREPWVAIPAGDGAPDGLCVDAEGGVWIALWGGHAVRRYDAGGTPTHEVRVGPARVSACALGGPDGTLLHITTSRWGLGARAEPDAGAVFVADAPVPGLPASPFGG